MSCGSVLWDTNANLKENISRRQIFALLVTISWNNVNNRNETKIHTAVVRIVRIKYAILSSLAAGFEPRYAYTLLNL